MNFKQIFHIRRWKVTHMIFAWNIHMVFMQNIQLVMIGLVMWTSITQMYNSFKVDDDNLDIKCEFELD